jgi:hypothetical protein
MALKKFRTGDGQYKRFNQNNKTRINQSWITDTFLKSDIRYSESLSSRSHTVA